MPPLIQICLRSNNDVERNLWRNTTRRRQIDIRSESVRSWCVNRLLFVTIQLGILPEQHRLAYRLSIGLGTEIMAYDVKYCII